MAEIIDRRTEETPEWPAPVMRADLSEEAAPEQLTLDALTLARIRLVSNDRLFDDLVDTLEGIRTHESNHAPRREVLPLVAQYQALQNEIMWRLESLDHPSVPHWTVDPRFGAALRQGGLPL